MDWRKAVMPDDWGKIFAFDTPIVEIFVRITIVYFFLVLLLRITLKRQTGGTTSLRDILVLVLIADAVQNGMAGQYTSVTDALVIAATLIFWAFVLDWVGYHSPALRRVLQPPPLPLIREGKVLEASLRQELLTRDDLVAQLRQQGVERPEEVRLAVMESDGRVSVLPRDPKKHQQQQDRPVA